MIKEIDTKKNEETRERELRSKEKGYK